MSASHLSVLISHPKGRLHSVEVERGKLRPTSQYWAQRLKAIDLANLLTGDISPLALLQEVLAVAQIPDSTLIDFNPVTELAESQHPSAMPICLHDMSIDVQLLQPLWNDSNPVRQTSP